MVLRISLRSPQPSRALFEMAPEHSHYTQLVLLARILAVKRRPDTSDKAKVETKTTSVPYAGLSPEVIASRRVYRLLYQSAAKSPHEASAVK